MNAASLAVIGTPSLHFMSERVVNVHTLASGETVHELAKSGVTL